MIRPNFRWSTWIAVISLGRDGQAVALVHRDDGPGAITINASRPPGAAGVSGSGVVCVLSFQAKTAGDSVIAITRPAAVNSAQQASAGQRCAGRNSGAVTGAEQMSVESPTRMRHKRERGLTLVELIVTVAILAILASAAVPITRFKVQRERGTRAAPRPVGDARCHRPLQGCSRQGCLPNQAR